MNWLRDVRTALEADGSAGPCGITRGRLGAVWKDGSPQKWMTK